MKKVFLSALVIATVGIFSSCNKEKDCECTTSTNSSFFEDTTIITKAKDCKDLESEATVGEITTKVTCKKK